MRWSAADLDRLLACKTDAEIAAAFPGRVLATVKRKRREIQADRSVSPGQRDTLGALAEMIDASGIDLSEIERLDKIELGEWDMGSKNADGEPDVTRLTTQRIVLTPKFAAGPAWPVVQPSTPVKLPPPSPRRRAKSKWKTAVILPDPQIGYRRDLDNLEALDAFHDEAAMSVALDVVAELEPDLIVNLGDKLDLAEIGRWVKEPGFQRTTQATINRGHLFLAEQRARAPKAAIRYLEGNHEARLPRWVMENAGWAFGLRRACLPDSWPVLSVPDLLRLDALGVEYVSGYPAGITWINDRLACVHGSKVRSSGSTAAAVIDDERVSVIFGHVHRIELQHKTRRTRHGGRSSLAASPGCLCRIDGAVPSTKGGTDPLGRPVQAVENWQHGVAVVTYQDGDAPFSLELVPIHDGSAILRGAPLGGA